MAHRTRPIFLLTDYGWRDPYAGQVKAVIAGIAPGAAIYDLTHDVEPFAIDHGAWLLETSLDALPADAVVVAVVDPGVGGERCGVAIFAGDRIFIGPDNGVLSGVFPDEARPVGGGPHPVPVPGGIDVRELCSPLFRRTVVSNTFHGRDIFAPAAAHLALGVDRGRLGPSMGLATLLPPFCARPSGLDTLHGEVIHVDCFGNVVTTLRASELFPEFEMETAGRTIGHRVRTFSDATGELFCYADSSRYLAIAVNQGSAAATLGIGRGEPVVVRRR